MNASVSRGKRADRWLTALSVVVLVMAASPDISFADTWRQRCAAACADEIAACVNTCGGFGDGRLFRRTCEKAVYARCHKEGTRTCAGPPPSMATQIESFDSEIGWSSAGNGTSRVASDPTEKREGAASLKWSHTINEEITKIFDAPKNLSTAAELRIWIRANRPVGSSCCGFTIRLLSSSGYFERHVLPEIAQGEWAEDVSEHDSWAAQPVGGVPHWDDITGLSFKFYGDEDTTVIWLDDLRMSDVSSTSPTVRRTAHTVTQESAGPLEHAFAWSNPQNAAVADGNAASVTLEDPGEFGFVSSTYLAATGFGFAVPTGSVIRGIRVEMRNKQADGWLVWDWEVRLIVDGMRQGDDKAFGDGLPDDFAYRYYGGPADLWGVPLTPEAVNSPGFGVALAMGTHVPPVTAFIDDIRIGVYFDPPASPRVSQ
jgi:hypothetical protein